MWSYNDVNGDKCESNWDTSNIIEKALAAILDELPESAPEMSPTTVSSTYIMSNPSTIWSGIIKREKEVEEPEVSPKEIGEMLHPSKRRVHLLKGELLEKTS